MSRCRSCDEIMQDYEIGSKTIIEISEDEFMEVDEDFCRSCLSTYVYGALDLDTKEYQHEEVTENLKYVLGVCSYVTDIADE